MASSKGLSLTMQELQRLETMFQLALANTDKQLVMKGDGTAYVKTGDIPAEWLRDSSAQMRPYLFFAKEDETAREKLKAVIEGQALYIAVDPYANAFREDAKVWTREFELDSLSYPVLLAWTYWKVTGDASVFTPALKTAFDSVLKTMETEQDHDGKSAYSHPSASKNPVGYTGMIWSSHRPSDDACQYNFLIPSQMQAVQALSALEEMESFMGRKDNAARAKKLKTEVQAGIEKFGVVTHPKHGRIYAYEVDGLGNANLMDDANLPSLLSIPYFGYKDENDKVYAATRRFVLSEDNPYFYKGRFKKQEISGVGSPHTKATMLRSLGRLAESVVTRKPSEQLGTLRMVFSKALRPRRRMGLVWPLAQLAQGLTTKNPDEQMSMLKMLLASDPGDRRLHEAYLPNNPKVYTRKDFGWPNALFAEFVLTVMRGRPPLPVPAHVEAGKRKRFLNYQLKPATG